MTVFRVLLLVTLVSSVEGVSQPSSPLSRLLYTGQKVPNGAYNVNGFPGCASPGLQIECRVKGDSWRDMERVDDDGSFFFEVPFLEAEGGIAIRVKDDQGQHSQIVELRTDHPLMGGMRLQPNTRGWVNVIASSTDEKGHGKHWLEIHDPEHIQRRKGKMDAWLQQHQLTIDDIKSGRVALPESLRTPADQISIRGDTPG